MPRRRHTCRRARRDIVIIYYAEIVPDIVYYDDDDVYRTIGGHLDELGKACLLAAHNMDEDKLGYQWSIASYGGGLGIIYIRMRHNYRANRPVYDWYTQMARRWPEYVELRSLREVVCRDDGTPIIYTYRHDHDHMLLRAGITTCHGRWLNTP
jgi:hypothetical protein